MGHYTVPRDYLEYASGRKENITKLARLSDKLSGIIVNCNLPSSLYLPEDNNLAGKSGQNVSTR